MEEVCKDVVFAEKDGRRTLCDGHFLLWCWRIVRFRLLSERDNLLLVDRRQNE